MIHNFKLVIEVLGHYNWFVSYFTTQKEARKSLYLGKGVLVNPMQEGYIVSKKSAVSRASTTPQAFLNPCLLIYYMLILLDK